MRVPIFGVSPTSRIRAGLGAMLCAAVLVLPATPAAAAPPAGVDCPETRAQLAGQHLTAGNLPDLTCADLHGAILDGLDLVQVDMAGADARGASFRHARMIQADLSGADLRDAHFEHADLGQAELDGVDARGASFAHADLIQTDLDRADLRGANLIGASLIQADLSDADLRGASAYWTLAIQAGVSGARVNLVDPRTFQLALLAVVLGLLRLGQAVRDRMRGGTGSGIGGTGTASIGIGIGAGVRKGALSAGVFLGISAFVWLMGWMLLPLMFIVVAYPLLAGAALVFLAGLVRGAGRSATPRRATRRPGPDPAPLGPQASSLNPWS